MAMPDLALTSDGRGSLIYWGVNQVCPRLAYQGYCDLNDSGEISDNERLPEFTNEGYWRFYLLNQEVLNRKTVEMPGDRGGGEANFVEALASQALGNLRITPRYFVLPSALPDPFTSKEVEITNEARADAAAVVADARETLVRLGEKVLPYLQVRLAELLTLEVMAEDDFLDEGAAGKAHYIYNRDLSAEDLKEIRTLCAIIGGVDSTVAVCGSLEGGLASCPAELLWRTPETPSDILLGALAHPDDRVGEAAVTGLMNYLTRMDLHQRCETCASLVSEFHLLSSYGADVTVIGPRFGILFVARPAELGKLIALCVDGDQCARELLLSMRNVAGVASQLGEYACQLRPGNHGEVGRVVELVGRMAEFGSPEADAALRALVEGTVFGYENRVRVGGRVRKVPVKTRPLDYSRVVARAECRRILRETSRNILDPQADEALRIGVVREVEGDRTVMVGDLYDVFGHRLSWRLINALRSAGYLDDDFNVTEKIVMGGFDIADELEQQRITLDEAKVSEKDDEDKMEYLSPNKLARLYTILYDTYATARYRVLVRDNPALQDANGVVGSEDTP